MTQLVIKDSEIRVNYNTPRLIWPNQINASGVHDIQGTMLSCREKWSAHGQGAAWRGLPCRDEATLRHGWLLRCAPHWGSGMAPAHTPPGTAPHRIGGAVRAGRALMPAPQHPHAPPPLCEDIKAAREGTPPRRGTGPRVAAGHGDGMQAPLVRERGRVPLPQSPSLHVEVPAAHAMPLARAAAHGAPPWVQLRRGAMNEERSLREGAEGRQ
jgi:hypothetical protein